MEDKNVSFEKYFLKYKNLIIRVIVDGSGDYQLAQEICQLVYERFYKNMDKVRPGGKGVADPMRKECADRSLSQGEE